MICPSAITLSGAPTGVGHVKVVAVDRRLTAGGQRRRRAGGQRLLRVALAGAVEVGGRRIRVVADPGVVVGGGERRDTARPSSGCRCQPPSRRCAWRWCRRRVQHGSVTDETVLPCSSGTDAKYTLTGCGPIGLLWKFQLDVVVTSWLPTAGAFAIPVGHVEVERLAAAVRVVDRDGPARGAVLA